MGVGVWTLGVRGEGNLTRPRLLLLHVLGHSLQSGQDGVAGAGRARDARVVEDTAFRHVAGFVEEAGHVLVVCQVEAGRHGGFDGGQEGRHGGGVEVDLVEVVADAVAGRGNVRWVMSRVRVRVRGGEGEWEQETLAAEVVLVELKWSAEMLQRGLAEAEESTHRYCSNASIWCDLEWSPAYSSGVPK